VETRVEFALCDPYTRKSAICIGMLGPLTSVDVHDIADAAEEGFEKIDTKQLGDRLITRFA
jgi:hypothetical protein